MFLKKVDVFKLQASLFMYDFDHNVLPKSFRHFVIKKNVTTDTRITRQFKLLVEEKPRINFVTCSQLKYLPKSSDMFQP